MLIVGPNRASLARDHGMSIDFGFGISTSPTAPAFSIAFHRSGREE